MEAAGIKIGLLGGTFNPIHFGHLRAAEEIAEKLALDRVLFIPSASPPHKDLSPVIPFTHRLVMVRLAIAGHSGFMADDLEGQRSGPSYTIDTLAGVRRLYGQNAEIFFLIGMDAFLEIHTWKEYRRLFALTRFVVFTREGTDPAALGPYLHKWLSPAIAWDSERQVFYYPGILPIYSYQIIRMDISSRDIRQRLSQGRSIRYLTPEAVREYIDINYLYSHRS